MNVGFVRTFRFFETGTFAGMWRPIAERDLKGTTEDDNFGSSVAMNDGFTLAVGVLNAVNGRKGWLLYWLSVQGVIHLLFLIAF